jgi:hypothetical protein
MGIGWRMIIMTMLEDDEEAVPFTSSQLYMDGQLM